MIMIYVGLTGKIFSKAGLRDLTLQIDILVTGSVNKVNKVYSGKMCDRAVCVHKLAYEGRHRFLLNKMEENDEDSFKLSSTIHDMQEKVNGF